MPRKSEDIIKILTGKSCLEQIEKLINESYDKLKINLKAHIEAEFKKFYENPRVHN